MTQRIQKILSDRGMTSRRQAEAWIAEGRVLVNGRVALLGELADPEVDEILVDGKKIPSPQKKVYIMLHKPRGFVTTMHDEKGRPDVASLVADCETRVYPVGRLDYDSEGLLLFTNDGDFANAMMHPKHEVEKTYMAWVTGYHENGTQLLKRRIVLDGAPISAPKVRLMDHSETNARYLITIHEGRNRQVRRMCEEAGMHVTRLMRIGEGKLRLGDLEKGKWRHLTEEEMAEFL